jgi:hypothetical protein
MEAESGLNKNEFLGNLPAIYTDYQLARQAHREKEDRSESITDFNRAMTESAKLEKAEEEMDAKFEALLADEYERGAGAKLPFGFSQALQNSNPDYEIKAARIKGSLRGSSFCFDILAKKVNANIIGTRTIDLGYRFVAKNGSTIYAIFTTIYGPEANVVIERCIGGFGLLRNPEHWVDFASVEFITHGEAEEYRREAKIR